MDWDDNASVSSNDSVEIQPANLHEDGVALNLMARMGYVEGMGLGADNQGMLEPIEQQKRPKFSGLGSTYLQDPVPHQFTDSGKLQYIRNQISSLESLHSVLSVNGPTTLDIQKFVESYSDSAFWIDDRLWEIAENCALHQLRSLPLQNFTQACPLLDTLKGCIPSSKYTSLLRTVWHSKALTVSTANLALILDQINALKELIPRTLLYELSENWASNNSIIETFFVNPELLTEASITLPAFVTRLLDAMSHRELPLKPLTSLVNLASTEQSLKYFKSVLECRSLEQQLDILSEYSALIKEKKVLSHLGSHCILPTWFTELSQSLKSGRLNQSWWYSSITRIKSLDLGDHDWLLQSLNLINTYLDTGRMPSPHAISNPHIPSLNELLEHYCHGKAYKLHKLTDSTGTLSSAHKSVQYKVEDDILYIKLPYDFAAISIFDLPKYIDT